MAQCVKLSIISRTLYKTPIHVIYNIIINIHTTLYRRPQNTRTARYEISNLNSFHWQYLSLVIPWRLFDCLASTVKLPYISWFYSRMFSLDISSVSTSYYQINNTELQCLRLGLLHAQRDSHTTTSDLHTDSYCSKTFMKLIKNNYIPYWPLSSSAYKVQYKLYSKQRIIIVFTGQLYLLLKLKFRPNFSLKPNSIQKVKQHQSSVLNSKTKRF